MERSEHEQRKNRVMERSRDDRLKWQETIQQRQTEAPEGADGFTASALKDFDTYRDEALKTADLDTIAVAREVETLLAKFANWVENADEQRRLRLNLYKPVIRLPDEQRKAVVEQIMQVLEQTAGSR